jgi:intein-encoded DNA endonuclease-like protein
MPIEAYYWLLGVCFSKITYDGCRREAFEFHRASLTYITEKEFARYLKEDVFKLDVSLIKVKQGKSQVRYGFHFPESKDTYAHHFQSRGILVHKEKREFPDIDKKYIAHFIRGYFDSQNSIHLRESASHFSIYIFINFSNYNFANVFVTFLHRNNIKRKKRMSSLK